MICMLGAGEDGVECGGELAVAANEDQQTSVRANAGDHACSGWDGMSRSTPGNVQLKAVTGYRHAQASVRA